MSQAERSGGCPTARPRGHKEHVCGWEGKSGPRKSGLELGPQLGGSIGCLCEEVCLEVIVEELLVRQ